MKKIYYLDIILMVVCATLYVIYFRNIESKIYLLIFSSCILSNAYISFRLCSVKKFDKNNKMGPKFRMGSIYLFLEQLLFITQIILFGVYNQESPIAFMLVYFMIWSFLTLEYAYVDNKKIIKLSGRYVLLDDISAYQISDNYSGDTYLDIDCNSGKKFKCSLSKQNFDLFISQLFSNNDSN